MKRLQNRIAESRFALPVTAVYTLAVWLAMCACGQRNIVELAVFALEAYLMAELNNRNALIRIYSRMVSCAFLVLGTMTASISGHIDALLVQLCIIATYLLLFSCYQNQQAQGRMFYAFACIGAASVIFPQILLYVPVIWILAGTNLMAFSWRNFWASIIGLTVPYWFIAGYCALTGNFSIVAQRFGMLTDVVPPTFTYELPEPGIALSLGFITLMAVIGAIHFLRNSYKDKIRTRMIYEMVIIMTAYTACLIILLPKYAWILMGILLVNVAILTAHFIALTKSKVTNIAFCLLTVAALAITAANMINNYVPPINDLSPWSL